MHDKIIIIFSSVIGIIIGIGSIIQSLILMILLYAISQSSLLNLIDSQRDNGDQDELADNLDDLIEEN